MNVNPAGSGLEDGGEFITHSAIDQAVVIASNGVLNELHHTRQVLRDIVYRVHNTYHAEGVAKRPWYKCHRTVCRQAQQLLEVERDEGE
jgi:hypothetical protein